MKRVTILGFSACLSACATSTLLQKTPVMSLSSAKSPDALEECIALVLPGTVNTIQGAERRTITAGGDGLTIAAVTITDGEPNLVELRQATPVNQAIRNKIRDCAN